MRPREKRERERERERERKGEKARQRGKERESEPGHRAAVAAGEVGLWRRRRSALVRRGEEIESDGEREGEGLAPAARGHGSSAVEGAERLRTVSSSGGRTGQRRLRQRRR